MGVNSNMERHWPQIILLSVVLFIILICFSQYSPIKQVIDDYQTELRERKKLDPEQFSSLPSFETSRWAVIKDFVDVFNNLSAPYLLAEGSLLNFHRNFSTGKADVDFSLELGWWNQSDHKSKLASSLTEKRLWHYDTFGKFGEDGYEEKWQRDGVSVD